MSVNTAVQTVDIRNLKNHVGDQVTIKGWVSNRRSGKGLEFVVMRDGSGYCQAVVAADNVNENQFNAVSKAGLETSIIITGNVVEDERQIGGYEIQVSEAEIVAYSEEYPIAKKEHGVDFLMDKRHLWLRSRKQWATMQIRNTIIFSMHQFFQEQGFVQMDAPIFTGNACEGTTDLFQTDFYGDPAYLSQSGQLYGEAMAMAMGKIYTFGPTFRAEKSKTRRHLSEFWMIEPEMAYYTNEMNMDLIEKFLRFLVGNVLEKNKSELEILERDTTILEKVVNPFPRMTYTEAVKILKGEKDVNGKNTIKVLEQEIEDLKAQIAENDAEIAEKEVIIAKGGIKKGKMNFFKNKVETLNQDNKAHEEVLVNLPQWMESAKNFREGEDFGGSDETVLTKLFDAPVMVYNWPTPIKAFYMKEVEGDANFVKGVDVLAPEGYGEIIGGAERETDIDVLKKKIVEHDLPMEAFEWYLDLRRYGSVPHAGFGIGLERFVSWMTGIKHVRESIPFPRMYGRLLP
jgi:asparaginyl-tRNA synthetase